MPATGYVIAEIGHNHQGKLETAMELFRAAKQAGASAVKLQKRDNRTLYTRAMYDRRTTTRNSFGSTYGTHREALEFGMTSTSDLVHYAKNWGSHFCDRFRLPERGLPSCP